MDHLAEKLSLLMDNELLQTEKEVLIDLLVEDPEARKIWLRYQLIRNALNNKLSPADKLLSDIKAALAHQGAISPPS